MTISCGLHVAVHTAVVDVEQQAKVYLEEIHMACHKKHDTPSMTNKCLWHCGKILNLSECSGLYHLSRALSQSLARDDLKVDTSQSSSTLTRIWQNYTSIFTFHSPLNPPPCM